MKNNELCIYINCATTADRLAAITMLLGMGLRWHGEDNRTAKEVEGDFPFRHYPTLQCYFDQVWRIAGTSHKKEAVTLGNAYEKLDKAMNGKKTVEVKLNDRYTAEITEDGVVVGCQTFPFEAIKNLHKELLEFEKE